MADKAFKFIFADTDIRGEVTRLQDSYREVLETHHYPAPVQALLGEFITAAVLLSATLKYEGILSLQARSNGPVPLIMAECTSDNKVRAIAQVAEDSVPAGAFRDLLAEGTLALTIEPTGGQRYQGIVPLDGATLGECLESYFRQSEQLDTRVLLFAQDSVAAGLMLQALPPQKITDREERARIWEHITTLASSLTPEEALGLDEETVLYRLFHEDKVLLLDPREVRFKCTCSRERVVRALESLGLEEAQSIIAERGQIEMNCEFCMASYTFEAPDLDQIFGADPGQSLH